MNGVVTFMSSCLPLPHKTPKFHYLFIFANLAALQRLLLDWIGNQPTHRSLIPENKAAVQLHTQVSLIGYVKT